MYIQDIDKFLSTAAKSYPSAIAELEVRAIPRTRFHISLLGELASNGASICDLGSGIGLFPAACAVLGMSVTMVDDFADPVNAHVGDLAENIHRLHGVNVVTSDVISSPPNFPAATFDVVTCFDSMEHWHGSPRALFHRVLEWLTPDGLFIVSTPNCVNLRKRLTVPFGYGKWSSIEDWYEAKTFRGHVREPDVGDLLHIAKDLKLEQIKVVGRNWLGYYSSNPLTSFLSPIIDRPLRLFPSLCSNIYLLGRKSHQQAVAAIVDHADLRD
jgi:2-polyprenyl-3-methyl-5-hydroxy-6-metoxy-1,4-benzoquinol methylase